jgi:hypothetical protein
MSIALYELTEGYKALWNLVDDNDSDLTMIETALQTVEGAIEVKANNIIIFLKSLDADAKAIKEEEQRLSARRKAIENKHLSIKQYLQTQMELAGIEKLKTATHSIGLQNNPPALQIIDVDVIPQKFLTLIPARYEPRKDDIKAAIKAGEVVPGCEVSVGRSIRIR